MISLVAKFCGLFGLSHDLKSEVGCGATRLERHITRARTVEQILHYGLDVPCYFRSRHCPGANGLWLPVRPERLPANVSGNLKLDELHPATERAGQCRTIRTAILLTLASCYLMWMITYMAQLHPLIG